MGLRSIADAAPNCSAIKFFPLALLVDVIVPLKLIPTYVHSPWCNTDV